jgi:hypothetical protein
MPQKPGAFEAPKHEELAPKMKFAIALINYARRVER